MKVWPARPELPQFGVISGTRPDGRTFTEMDQGMKSRGGSAGAVMQVPVSMIFTASQLARFARWWDEDTRGGNDWFLIKDQQFDGAAIEGFADNDGTETTGTYYWLARFASGTPSENAIATRRGGPWSVSFPLFVRRI